ncbi:SDR family oxidoreductase [Salinarimonas rosea]|uniref:SDR family oxidoreductase n=1 Tax=Salinarimonas rosea TaxID=552063 RepID=UPI00048C8494|nr:SDR family oxidoreductase [Salinarimonas rosea]
MTAERGGPPAQHQPTQPGREHAMSPRPDYAPRFPGSGRLAGEAALITGGDSGIGRATAVSFAREGADVAIVYLEEAQDAAETAAAVEAEGRRCLRLPGDVRDPAFCREAAARTVEAFGRLDVLVNDAAEQHVTEAIEDITPEQLEATFRTNIFGYVYMIQAALAHMRAGGRIVNCGSVTAVRGSPHLVDYSATKGAIMALTRSLAKPLAARGIRINGVAPGPIWTPLIPATFPAEHVQDFGTKTPMGRPGQPNEVASCFLFLACADSSYVTGQFLHPNGGDAIGS